MNTHFIPSTAIMCVLYCVQGDFCNMTEIPDNTFDGGFAFEATCHAKSLVLVYKEIFRVLKPGALFADMAWSVTDDYNPQNPKHVQVMNGVMVSLHFPDETTSHSTIDF